MVTHTYRREEESEAERREEGETEKRSDVDGGEKEEKEDGEKEEEERRGGRRGLLETAEGLLLKERGRDYKLLLR